MIVFNNAYTTQFFNQSCDGTVLDGKNRCTANVTTHRPRRSIQLFKSLCLHLQRELWFSNPLWLIEQETLGPARTHHWPHAYMTQHLHVPSCTNVQLIKDRGASSHPLQLPIWQ